MKFVIFDSLTKYRGTAKDENQNCRLYEAFLHEIFGFYYLLSKKSRHLVENIIFLSLQMYETFTFVGTNKKRSFTFVKELPM